MIGILTLGQGFTLSIALELDHVMIKILFQQVLEYRMESVLLTTVAASDDGVSGGP